MISPYIFYGTTNQSGLLNLVTTHDAYTNESSPDGVNNSAVANITRYHGGGFSRVTYFTFDQTGVGTNNIDSAILRVYGATSGDLDVGVYPVSDASWDETTLTFNNAPVWGVGPISINKFSTTQEYIEFDVSEYAYMIGDGPISFVLRPTPEEQWLVNTNSGENAQFPPELIVTYGSGNAKPRNLPVIPNFNGYGTKMSTFGREIYKVTNTSTSGAGSFADAVSRSNRIVVFETSATIDISSLEINASHLWIAGQTAPSPGIILKGELNPLHSSNTIIQGLSILTDLTTTTDCVTVGNGDSYRHQTKIIFDRCWFANAADEQVDCWNKLGDFDFRYCIFGPGSDSAGKNYGALFGGDATYGSNFRVSLDKCLFIHCAERSPLAKAQIVTMNNCIVYNGGAPHRTYLSSREPTNQCNGNFTGCLWVDGPSTTTSNKPIYLDPTDWVAGSQAWVSGCDWEGETITTQWTDLVELNGVTGAEATGSIDFPEDMVTMDVSLIEADITAKVGPKHRFTELQAYIDNLTNRDGVHPTGGPFTVPTLAENTTTHNVPSTTNYGISGYTAAEEYLHALIF